MTPRTDAHSARPSLPMHASAFQADLIYRFPGRQRGVFSIMLAPLLIVMVGFSALAVDIGLLYSRNVDLHGIAKAAALAAARELNGTAAGITAARTAARVAAERLSYQNGIRVIWRDEALTFGTASTSNDWVSAETAIATPLTRYFVRVDTSGLGDEINSVNTSFMPVLSASLTRVQLGATATAGKTAINVSPIAICAMSPDAATPRTNPGLPTPELVEYGFRRGVSYDLMQLNPNGITPVRYLINPVSAPGAQSTAFDTSIVGPFMCVGRMWMPGIQGGSIRVSSLPSSAPLGALNRQLNSRFDDYPAGLCNSNGAPPDFNIKAYAYNVAGDVTWMIPGTGSPAALTTTERQRLETIADLPTPPDSVTPGSYGPLWSFAKAARFTAYRQGYPEPAAGYATFATTDWPTLYKSGPTASGYTTPAQGGTPYKGNGNTYQAPNTNRTEISTEFRRVLNVPLLACPVSSGTNVPATVVAVGKFFMTVPATEDSLIGEFAGVVSDPSAAGQVELY